MPALDSNGYEIVTIGGSAGPLQAQQSGPFTVTPIGVNVIVTQSFTRPANTTPYTNGDTVTSSAAAIITFTGCSRVSNSTGNITGATLIDSAYQVMRGDFDLYLFDTTAAITSDNAAFTPTDAEMATLVGVISFEAKYSKPGTSTVGAGGNVVFDGRIGSYSKPRMMFKTGAASTSLFGIMVARNAYVPVSSEGFTIRLMIEQD